MSTSDTRRPSLTGVSDDGRLLSSESGLAEETAGVWRTALRKRGVVTGDGQRFVIVDLEGATPSGEGHAFVITSYRRQASGWVPEHTLTTRPVDAALTPPYQLQVSRDGTVLLVRFDAGAPGQSRGAMAVYLRDEGGWRLAFSSSNPPGAPLLSADGRTVALTDYWQTRVVTTEDLRPDARWSADAG